MGIWGRCTAVKGPIRVVILVVPHLGGSVSSCHSESRWSEAVSVCYEVKMRYDGVLII